MVRVVVRVTVMVTVSNPIIAHYIGIRVFLLLGPTALPGYRDWSTRVLESEFSFSQANYLSRLTNLAQPYFKSGFSSFLTMRHIGNWSRNYIIRYCDN